MTKRQFLRCFAFFILTGAVILGLNTVMRIPKDRGYVSDYGALPGIVYRGKRYLGRDFSGNQSGEPRLGISVSMGKIRDDGISYVYGRAAFCADKNIS